MTSKNHQMTLLTNQSLHADLFSQVVVTDSDMEDANEETNTLDSRIIGGCGIIRGVGTFC